MAGDEHQTEEVVSNAVVDRRIEIGHGHLLLRFELAAKLLMFALQELVSAPEIDGAMLRGGHQPGPRIVRNARLGPLFERSDQSVLREFFGQPNISHDVCKTGDDPGGLNPPDRFDGAVCEGNRHGYPSHHRRLSRASGRAAP